MISLLEEPNYLGALLRKHPTDMKGHIFVLGLSVLMTCPGFCTIVSYTYTARVSTVWGSSFFGTHPAVGDSLTGFFSYDTAAPIIRGSPAERLYSESLPFTFGFNLRGLTLQSDSDFVIATSKQVPVHTIQMADYDGTVNLNGVPTNVLSFDIAFTIQNPDLPLDLPTDFEHLGPISFAHGSFTTLSDSGVTYDITSMTLVPEPGAGVLLVGGTFLLLSRLRNGRRDNRQL